jgi:hypothetical protein
MVPCPDGGKRGSSSQAKQEGASFKWSSSEELQQDDQLRSGIMSSCTFGEGRLINPKWTRVELESRPGISRRLRRLPRGLLSYYGENARAAEGGTKAGQRLSLLGD